MAAPLIIDFLGVEAVPRVSTVSGAPWAEYTGKKVALRIPRPLDDVPQHVTKRPLAYWVPPTYPEIIERLKIHGVRMEHIDAARTVDVEMDRILEWTFEPEPFEGHFRVTPGRIEKETHRERFAPGSVRVPTDQPLGELVMVLLEPNSPDSFFQWGFFMELFSRTEYFESYVLEPLAERMLEANPELRAEFASKLATDEAFKADPRARLEWFYARTPWIDERWRLYPVAREMQH